MDGRHRGALPHAAGQDQQALQIHRDVFSDAEDRRRPPHSQLLLLGHQYGRQLHRAVGEPHHVLRGERVRRLHRLGAAGLQRCGPPAGGGSELQGLNCCSAAGRRQGAAASGFVSELLHNKQFLDQT